MTTKQLIKEIDLWLADYNSLVADMDFDSGTLEGSASQLLIEAKGALLAKPAKK